MKLVLFDLDGVLIDAKQIHFESLNRALGAEYAITEEEHLNIYDGRKTRQKLQMLTDRKGLSPDDHDVVYIAKQAATIELIKKLKPIEEIKLSCKD